MRDAEQRMRASLQATMQMPPSPMVALVTQWLRPGVAAEIIRAIRNEAAARQQLAARFLKGVTLRRGRPATISGCRCRNISTAPTCCRI